MPPMGRVATFDSDGRFHLPTEQVGPPESGELLIDVSFAGISAGTHGGRIADLRSNPDPAIDRRTVGYQTSGEVIETGPDVERFHAGDRVAAMGAGYALQADFNRVPVNLCVPLAADVDAAGGALIHLATTALQSLRRFDPDPGATVAVIGLGVVGQFVCQLSRTSGCSVVGGDPFLLRRETARESGADRVYDPDDTDLAAAARSITDDKGLAGGYLCFGGDGDPALQSLLEAMQTAPDGETLGTVVLVGGTEVTVRGGARFGNVDIRCSSRTGPGYHDPDYERGREYPDGYVPWSTRRNLEQVMQWMATERLAPSSLITHRFPLAEIDAAYDQVIEAPEETVGVVIDCREGP